MSSFSITAAARYHLTCHYWNHVLWKTRIISFTTKGITSICIENCLAFGVMKLYKVVEAPKGSWWLVHRFPVKAQAFFVVKSRRATLSISAIRFSGQKHPITNWHCPHQEVKFVFVFSWTMFISMDISERLEGISFKYKMPAQNLKACRVNQQKALYSSLQCV